MLDFNGVFLVLMLVLLIVSVFIDRFPRNGSTPVLRGTRPPLPSWSTDAYTAEPDFEGSLVRMVAKQHLTKLILAALLDANGFLTPREIRQRFPEEERTIPDEAIRRACRVLAHGPFVDWDVTRGGDRFKIRPYGRELFNRIIQS